MRVVLLGAPGSGKGTQCKQLVGKYGLLHLSSGDILRQERAEGSELGKKAQSYMDSGALVPDDIIIEMMIKAIEQAPDTGFILDGFPRTVNQAIELDKSLTKAGLKIDIIINLEVEAKVIENRITGRRSCPTCGAVYHIENMKPKVEGKCDNDGTELIQRPDDTLEVVANRLEAYYQQTQPLVDYYKKNNVVFDVDANMDADSVKTIVFKELDALIKN
jgi:adenylate kinase